MQATREVTNLAFLFGVDLGLLAYGRLLFQGDGRPAGPIDENGYKIGLCIDCW